MDPQSVAFVPNNNSESWRLYNDLLRLQQVQADHSDRLVRLERRQDEDHRMKSVWGGHSPFPSVLSGTPQQQPIHHLKDDFDDDSQNLIGSLHLDPDDEPRRMGATSRANSVRFDESANQGHWAHASRSSIDLLPRSASSMAGGMGMTERSSSHKSDGRASSVHSVRSAASGRASSINLDTAYGLFDAARSPLDTPAIAPGLLILGPVPAIVRCWMNTNFKHDALHYAAVATASYKSQIDLRLVQQLGFEHCIIDGVSGGKLIEMPVYFAEAVPHAVSSRPTSPAPQVPTVTITFSVVESAYNVSESKAIQIIIGSDVLRSHNADILFSSNSMTLYDDDQCKLSIPLARPENEASFNCLSISASMPWSKPEGLVPKHRTHLNGLGQTDQDHPLDLNVDEERDSAISPRLVDEIIPPIEKPAVRDVAPIKRQSSLSARNSRAESKGSGSPPAAQESPAQPASSPSIWSNWRRESSSQNNALEWGGSAPKTKDSGYQRRDTGIKVLRPSRTISRTFSGASVASSSPADGNKSRFFEEGKKRGAAETVAGEEKAASRKSSTPSETQADAGSTTAASKTRANPVGGATAFSWLHSGSKP